MKLVTVEEMRAIEQQADGRGLTYSQMMENAGTGLAQWIIDWIEPDNQTALGLVGSGNNGGDTLVALAYLQAHGWQTSAYLTAERAGDALVERLKSQGGVIYAASDDLDSEKLVSLVAQSPLLLDGILGTGARLPLKPEIARVLGATRTALEGGLNEQVVVVAVDCPSGVDCTSGEATPEVIRADVTVCMAAVKTGLLKFPAFNYVGDLQVVEIGPADLLNEIEILNRYVVDDEMVWSALPQRAADSHKGTFGTALIAAGSINYTGAALLAGRAAYRSGAGLVTMAVPEPLYGPLAGVFPEATWLLLPHQSGSIAAGASDLLHRNFERVTALLLGPGWGQDDVTLSFLKRFLGSDIPPSRGPIGFLRSDAPAANREAAPIPPLVVDADGLKLLAKLENWFTRLPVPSVLTPHPGEMSILCGLTVDEIQADRTDTALRFAGEWGHVVVLKGALTVVAAPDGRAAVIPAATAALARAGTGDVLSGLITGLRAQGLPAFEAAYAGAWIHAQAGLAASERLGTDTSVLAGDVVETIAEVFARLDR